MRRGRRVEYRPIKHGHVPVDVYNFLAKRKVPMRPIDDNPGEKIEIPAPLDAAGKLIMFFCAITVTFLLGSALLAKGTNPMHDYQVASSAP